MKFRDGRYGEQGQRYRVRDKKCVGKVYRAQSGLPQHLQLYGNAMQRLEIIAPTAGTVMENKIMQTTMKNLISVLERKATEAKKCRSNNLEHFEAGGIAHELNMLRLKIIQEIFLSKGVTETSTYTLLNQKIDQESKEIFDKILEATKALLVPLQHKVPTFAYSPYMLLPPFRNVNHH